MEAAGGWRASWPEIPARLGRGLWGLMMPLDRHKGRRARYREGMSWGFWEFGRSGLTFLQIIPFASVSPGAMSASCVRRDVSVEADGIQHRAGKVSPGWWGSAPASPAGPALSCASVLATAGPDPARAVVTDAGFCPIIANKKHPNTEVSLLALWLQKGRLIPDPLQPAFTNLP